MQPTGQTQKGQTNERVQSTEGGQGLAVGEIKSIQLSDGWHDIANVELVYTDQAGQQQRKPFNEALSFSDTPRER